MTTLSLDPEDIDHEFLDEFLSSDRAPENCMMLSDLDGFLTGIAIGPELVKPSEWLPVVWGHGEPEFESEEEAQRVLNSIFGRYNEILQLLQHAPGHYQPVFWQAKDGGLIADDWAEGFMDAVRMRPRAWAPLFDSESDWELIAPIIVHCLDEEGKPFLNADGEKFTAVLREAAEYIAPSVVDIDRYWKSGGKTSERQQKVGRNEPCPCGSAKKYKRCCGAN